MSKRKTSKISTDGASSMGQNPFSGLSTAGLPAGEGTPVENKSEKGRLSSVSFKGRIEIRREKAGRGGKTVTTLRELPAHLPISALEKITFDLKKKCACGGTLKGRVIELQGDVCDQVHGELEDYGFKPVRAGG